MTDIDPADIAAKGCRWVHTADGRVVEYSVLGSTRPDARTLLAGYFASTRLAPAWLTVLEALNVRLIEVSLPGLGLSSLQPGRRVADWPKTDVEPILEAEGVQDFTVYGVSYGTIHAMAVAQHFGAQRVQAMGLRVPYFGLPLSEELGLPDGQPRFPTTDVIQSDSLEARRWRFALRQMMGKAPEAGDEALDYPQEVSAMMATGKLTGENSARMSSENPDQMKGMEGHSISAEALLYMMTRDVALDLPGLDPQNVELSGDRVVVWYAADDEDCPPSHGEWLAQHFKARTRIFEGYGHVGGAALDHPQFIEALMNQGR